MVNFINSWVQGIILSIIIATIIEIILPEGNNKKYVKTIIGIYIMFVIVNPLISKALNKNINIEEIMDDTAIKMSKFETNNEISIETNTYIEETYKQKLEEDIKKKVIEKGYNIYSLSLSIKTEDNEEYGQIDNVVIQLSKEEKNENNIENKTNNTVNNIESIQINISNSNNASEEKNIENEKISKEEMETLKEYLNSAYGVSKEKIYINE